MIHRMNMWLISLVLVFAFCQVIGTMCAVPDLSMTNDGAQLAEDMSHMSCPMDGTNMCPPSAISSPERQLKHVVTINVDRAALMPSAATILAAVPIPTLYSWSSVFSIVPLSIASSSVLRI